MALTQRGQEFGDDRLHEMQKMVKQGKRGAADAQTRLGRAMEDQKDNLQDAIDIGKQAATHRKDEMVNRFQDLKAQVN